MATETSVMGIVRASRPPFRNDHDKIAFAVHATFLASGYALTATGRAALSHTTSDGEVEVGIEGWDDFDDSYGFVYVKEKCKVIVKCVVIEDLLAVDAAKIGNADDEPFHLQINVKDYVRNSSSGGGNYGQMYNNFGGLVDCLKSAILEKLESNPSKGSDSTSSTTRGHDNVVQTSTEPTMGIPLDVQSHPSGLVYPPIAPSGFGDLDPGIPAGVFPQRGRFGGDMLVGPNDPRWMGGVGEDFRSPGGLSGFPGVPSGARFDPYGPPGVPGFEPDRFVRRPQRPGGGGVHPDLQHFQDLDFI